MTTQPNGKPRLRVTTLAQLLARVMPTREHLIAPWLKTGESALVWAPPGCGKSMLTLSLALMMAGGGKVMDWSNASPKKVLLMDGEMNMADLQERTRDLLPSVEGCDAALAGANLRILARQDQDPDADFPDLATDGGQRRTIKRVRDGKYAVVILDNFSTLASCYDENDAAAFNDIVKFLMRLKQAGIGCIMVHHANKGGQGYRGSTKLATTFEAIFGMKRGQRDTPGTSLAFEIAWEKYRGADYDANTRSRSVRLMQGFEGSGLRWEFGAAAGEQVRELVSLVRSLEYSTQKELADALGVDQSTISRMRNKAIHGDRLITAHDWDKCLEAAQEDSEDPATAEF